MTDAPNVGAEKTIVFAHANGFPAGTYRQLFEPWREAGWRVLALPKIGHDPRFPVTSNWPHLRDELLHFIDSEAAAPAYLVGHSLGGYLTLLAATRRPEVARGIVLLDSPLLPTWMARSRAVLQGLGDRRTLLACASVQTPPRTMAERRCGTRPFRLQSAVCELGSRSPRRLPGVRHRGRRRGAAPEFFASHRDDHLQHLAAPFVAALACPAAALPGGIYRRDALRRTATCRPARGEANRARSHHDARRGPPVPDGAPPGGGGGGAGLARPLRGAALFCARPANPTPIIALSHPSDCLAAIRCTE